MSRTTSAPAERSPSATATPSSTRSTGSPTQCPFVVATRDWHPPNHNSFREQGGPWPAHCVQETGGAELHPRLHTSEIDAIVDAGREPGDEGYSGFEHTELERLLRDQGVDTVHVGGLALDYCVKETALDARRPASTSCCTSTRRGRSTRSPAMASARSPSSARRE